MTLQMDWCSIKVEPLMEIQKVTFPIGPDLVNINQPLAPFEHRVPWHNGKHQRGAT